MKPIIFITFFFTSIASLHAQHVGSELRAYLRKEGYSISTEQYAYLSKGEKAGHTKTFYDGTQYAIVAYSENSDVKDVDIYLYDEDGSLLVKDTDSDTFAIISYTPYTTREMRAVIKNYDSYSSTKEYKCEFIIAYK